MSIDPGLAVQVSELRGYAVVTAIGSIDATNCAMLDEQLDQALQLTDMAVIVDLAEVDFCDSTGLHTFVQARRKATTRGVIVILAGLRNRVKYVFTITQLEGAFFTQPDLDTAVRWLDNGPDGHTNLRSLPTLSD